VVDSQLNERLPLLIDNCPAHTNGSLGLKNLQIEFIPPSTTVAMLELFRILKFISNFLLSKWIRKIEEREATKKIKH